METSYNPETPLKPPKTVVISEGKKVEKEEERDDALSEEGMDWSTRELKDWICSKCKSCQEFTPAKDKNSVCDACSCELIFHIPDADEDPADGTSHFRVLICRI